MASRPSMPSLKSWLLGEMTSCEADFTVTPVWAGSFVHWPFVSVLEWGLSGLGAGLCPQSLRTLRGEWLLPLRLPRVGFLGGAVGGGCGNRRRPGYKSLLCYYVTLQVSLPHQWHGVKNACPTCTRIRRIPWKMHMKVCVQINDEQHLCCMEDSIPHWLVWITLRFSGPAEFHVNLIDH